MIKLELKRQLIVCQVVVQQLLHFFFLIKFILQMRAIVADFLFHQKILKHYQMILIH